MDNANSEQHQPLTDLPVKLFIGDILKLLGEHFGGGATINQLRIGHYIGLISLYQKRPTTNTELAEHLAIPKTTVSRIVSECMQKRWVGELNDPEDARRKLLAIDDAHPLADNFEAQFGALLEELLFLYSNGGEKFARKTDRANHAANTAEQ